MHVNGFTYGPLTPLLACFTSFLGSVIALQSASRARAAGGDSRVRWLAMGAFAMGGTAIWLMHFIAMLGFTVPGAEIRYDPLLTLASLAVAVAVSAAGLTLAVRDNGLGALLPAGFVTGSGIAGMYYLGIAAMDMARGRHYDVPVIAASEAIAVVGATAALWFALRVRGLPSTIGAAVIMGITVTAMHYTGMAGLHVTTPATATGWSVGMLLTPQGAPSGLSTSELLTPLMVAISATNTIMLLTLVIAPTERELREEQRIEGLVQALRERSY